MFFEEKDNQEKKLHLYKINKLPPHNCDQSNDL